MRHHHALPDAAARRRRRHLAHPQGAALFLGAGAPAKTAGPGDARIPRDIVTDEAGYLAEFAHLPAGLAAIADVSPSYLQEPAAAARIEAFAPDARIVILVREPAAKIMSQYTHLWAEGRETLPFEDAFAAARRAGRKAGYSTMFDYEAGGRYAEAVERYLARFGRERVMIAAVRGAGRRRIRPPGSGSRPSSASASAKARRRG